jgi:glycosyltransferase involved in cell wall biosynthesis
MPDIRARLAGVTLVVAGEFWEDKAVCLKTMEELGIRDAVVIDDRYIPNEELGTYFSAADVLVAPYTRVTGSAVVKMARGFGLPVITTSLDSSVEEGERPGRGVTVPPGDVQALSDAVVGFFESRTLCSAPPQEAEAELESGWSKLVYLLEGATIEDHFSADAEP